MRGASEKHAMQQSWKRNQKGPSGGKDSPPAPVPPPLCGFDVWLPLPLGTVASLVAECPAPCLPHTRVSPTWMILFVLSVDWTLTLHNSAVTAQKKAPGFFS